MSRLTRHRLEEEEKEEEEMVVMVAGWNGLVENGNMLTFCCRCRGNFEEKLTQGAPWGNQK